MFKKKPIIEYLNSPRLDTGKQHLVPSIGEIPKWYKDSPTWKRNEMTSYPDGGVNSTIKACMPFLQALTTGYMLTTPVDLIVKHVDGGPFITWKTVAESTVSSRDPGDHDLVPTPIGHFDANFVWRIPTSFRVPVGYSLLFTHPFNRFDLPFTTLTGVVDGGFTMPLGANIPFFLKNNFEGIIPVGTPYAQILPFKNTDWKSEKTPELEAETEKARIGSSSRIQGWYKHTFWNKKEYL
jgi:hypothetical protein